MSVAGLSSNSSRCVVDSPPTLFSLCVLPSFPSATPPTTTGSRLFAVRLLVALALEHRTNVPCLSQAEDQPGFTDVLLDLVESEQNANLQLSSMFTHPGLCPA